MLFTSIRLAMPWNYHTTHNFDLRKHPHDGFGLHTYHLDFRLRLRHYLFIVLNARMLPQITQVTRSWVGLLKPSHDADMKARVTQDSGFVDIAIALSRWVLKSRRSLTKKHLSHRIQQQE